jgi:glycosyltransferase involved in cell wall biosynthesis
MIRICRSLAAAGYSVVLTGRQLPDSRPLREEIFEQKRLPCRFKSGKLFYLEFNIRLFVFLLFRKMDGVCAIDLDTILPCLLASRLKRVTRIYDAHEYFSEMKEVISRKGIRRIWKEVEKFAIPRFAQGYTVSDSIADEFRVRYGVGYEVIRNVPLLSPEEVDRGRQPGGTAEVSKKNGGPDAVPLPAWVESERFLLYQGAVNEARGLESLIPAMRQIRSHLLICGEGNRMQYCRDLVAQYGLGDKIVFTGRIEPGPLTGITRKAYIGINLVDPVGLNQYYSLANKFFDYIHAEVPQVTMDFPEYRKVNDQYPVALLIADTDEKKIASALNNLLENNVLYEVLKGNCRQARLRYNWQEEEKRLIRLYQKILS